MNSFRSLVLSAAAYGLLAPIALAAQTTILGATGIELRYHGDTIWRMRDTTMTRLILRGDTARRTMFVSGRFRMEQTYVQVGDSAIIVSSKDSTGKERPPIPGTARAVPVSIVSSEAAMVENSLRQSAMQARMPISSSWDAPLSSDTERTYLFGANTRIVQFKDTVRYIRGCTAAPPIDTTAYVLFATDSVKRVSPNPRMFDRHMARAVQGDMSSANLRQRVAQSAEIPSAPIPALRKWPCDQR